MMSLNVKNYVESVISRLGEKIVTCCCKTETQLKGLFYTLNDTRIVGINI